MDKRGKDVSNDIVRLIDRYYKEIEKDENHRFQSWEHCYYYFQNCENTDDSIDLGCLHLGMYLASWGMYRGSSFLIDKDYLIHKCCVEELVKLLKDNKNRDFLLNDDKDILKEVIGISNKIRRSYDRSVTDTLVTKIMLGTLGCVPAYDKYARDGMKCHGICQTFNEKSLQGIRKFYKENDSSFDKAKKTVDQKNRKVTYPIAKLIDMYLFQKGRLQATQ